MAKRIVSNHETALETLTREELGMAEGEAGSPWVAAATSFFTFALGALIPMLPWLFIGGAAGVAVSAALSAAGLFLTGAITTLFTGRSIAFSGARMVGFGAAGAIVSFLAGGVIGAGTGV
jgi:VIT1/CCC1 family predicted Fe2+/Mn2+ transporter